jgi:hypothetical protein
MMSTANNTAEKFWPRAIILADMNAFFASVEQHDNVAWRSRPVAITNGFRVPALSPAPMKPGRRVFTQECA